MNDALAVVRRIGDKLLRETPFAYRLEVAPTRRVFDGMQFVDFGRTFGLGRPAVAYAWTRLCAAQAMKMKLHAEHNDGCKIWLNGRRIYENGGDRKINLVFDERSIEMTHDFELALQPGFNSLLIKSETRGGEWRVYLQPPSTNGAVGCHEYPEIGLHGVEHVDDRVVGLTNWLVIGPFGNPAPQGTRLGLETPYPPETEFRFGRMYSALDAAVTWTIPKIEILGAMIDPAPWGTAYQWNYHNGGVAWAMQHLAEAANEKKYAKWASRFCDFHLEGVPFVEYQVKTLNAVESANHFIVDTPLLDFTLAPSLPFLYRLRREDKFPQRERYERWVARMLGYARDEQVRLPGHGIYTRTTPRKYTTWTDDLFMGIPFLVQAALYSGGGEASQIFWEDAAHQVLEFNSQVWNEDAGLYMHARYSGSAGKLPHWSRCNGWAIWAMTEVLQDLPAGHPRRPAILEHYRKHAASLASRQAESGFWFNVLDRPDSRPEVSGTAIFVMAFARGVRHGWLERKVFEPAAWRGWNALQSQIEEDGTVHGICMGTMCADDVNYYLERPFYDNDTHGLFAVLFAGIEMHHLLASKSAANQPAFERASLGAMV